MQHYVCTFATTMSICRPFWKPSFLLFVSSSVPSLCLISVIFRFSIQRDKSSRIMMTSEVSELLTRSRVQIHLERLVFHSDTKRPDREKRVVWLICTYKTSESQYNRIKTSQKRLKVIILKIVIISNLFFLHETWNVFTFCNLYLQFSVAGRICHSSTGSFKDLFNLKLLGFFAGGEVRTTLIAYTGNLIKTIILHLVSQTTRMVYFSIWFSQHNYRYYDVLCNNHDNHTLQPHIIDYWLWPCGWMTGDKVGGWDGC